MTTEKTGKFDTDETVHVRYVVTNRGRREYYAIMRDSERRVSGTSLARFHDRTAACAAANEHNRNVSGCAKVTSGVYWR